MVAAMSSRIEVLYRVRSDAKSIAAHERDILLANAEAHRFAITYHLVRRGKALTA